MARFYIIDARAGVGDGGFACGPVDGPVVAEALLKDEDGEEFYFCLAEAGGMPNYYITDKPTYDIHTKMDFTDENSEYLHEHSISFGFDYEDILSEPENEYYDIARYLIYLVRCSLGEEQWFIDKTKGHWTDEIEIPMSDIEEEMLAEMEEDEEDDEE